MYSEGDQINVNHDCAEFLKECLFEMYFYPYYTFSVQLFKKEHIPDEKELETSITNSSLSKKRDEKIELKRV